MLYFRLAPPIKSRLLINSQSAVPSKVMMCQTIPDGVFSFILSPNIGYDCPFSPPLLPIME